MANAHATTGRRLAVACAMTLLACAMFAAPAGAADARARLTKLTRDVAEHAARWPFEEPSLPGALRRGPDIVPVTAAVIDSDRAFRAEAARELAALEPSLSRDDVGARADAAVLADWLARARVSRDSLRTFATDPGAPWPRIDAALRALLVGKGTPLCHRLGIGTRRLRAIPEALRAGQTLVEVPDVARDAVDAAIAAFERTHTLLRVDIPAGVRECRDPGSVAGFAEADTIAARAVEAYLEWLRTDVRPATVPVDSLPAALDARLGRVRRDGLPRAAAAPRAPGDSLREVVADSLLRVYARAHANSLRATLGTRDVALAWADYVLAVRAAGRSASLDTSRTDEVIALESIRRIAADTLGERFSPRTFLIAVVAEGPVFPAAVGEAVLRRLGVH